MREKEYIDSLFDGRHSVHVTMSRAKKRMIDYTVNLSHARGYRVLKFQGEHNGISMHFVKDQTPLGQARAAAPPQEMSVTPGQAARAQEALDRGDGVSHTPLRVAVVLLCLGALFLAWNLRESVALSLGIAAGGVLLLVGGIAVSRYSLRWLERQRRIVEEFRRQQAFDVPPPPPPPPPPPQQPPPPESGRRPAGGR